LIGYEYSFYNKETLPPPLPTPPRSPLPE
jgi:hypothetical protein